MACLDQISNKDILELHTHTQNSPHHGWKAHRIFVLMPEGRKTITLLNTDENMMKILNNLLIKIVFFSIFLNSSPQISDSLKHINYSNN